MRQTMAVMILFGAATISCSAQVPENRHKLVDPGDAAEFAAQLRSNNVPFRVDKDGSIWYPSDKEEVVDRLLKDVLAKRGGGVSYPDPIDMQSLKDKLTKAGIPFREVTRLGKQWVTWDPSFDERANAIQSEVDKENSERYRRARESQK